MAICFTRTTILGADRGDSAVGLGAYIARGRWWNEMEQRWIDFSADKADLVASKLFLPDWAPPEFQDPNAFWNAAEAAELKAYRPKEKRFRKNAQLARHVILALPKELTDKENQQLVEDFVRRKYLPHNVGVLAAIHRPDDPEIGNHHAHLLVTTRAIRQLKPGETVTALKGHFEENKARGLNAEILVKQGKRLFIQNDNLPGEWRAYQNGWFQEHGLDLRVDPSQIVGGKHWGNARYVPGNEQESKDQERRELAREAIQDPHLLLAEATKHQAVFSEKTLQTILARHDIRGAEATAIIKRAMTPDLVIELVDPQSAASARLFTTVAVRHQEEDILLQATRLQESKTSPAATARRRAEAEGFAKSLNLTDEQRQALFHAVAGPKLSLIRGVAGAGKSHTIKAIRQTLEEVGLSVIGLGPTNTVVADMASESFARASTLHRELFLLNEGRTRWNNKTCLIVDEAGMVDSNILQKVLTRAADVGAKVILVGDEAQLASVERGGMFGHLKKVFGAAEIATVRRQHRDWAKQASLDFASGNIAEAVEAYDQHGCLNWGADVDAAMAALVRQVVADGARSPGGSRFVFAGTNKSVVELNRRIQEARWRTQNVVRHPFTVKRNDVETEIEVVFNDRIQFYGNERKLGITNGMVGTLVGRRGQNLIFRPDHGEDIEFDPVVFKEWNLGYAGTVYRGQGKTLDFAYALYDSPFSWNTRTTYVGMTRHRDDVQVFIPRTLAKDKDALIRQMSRPVVDGPSLTWMTAEEAKAERDKRSIRLPVDGKIRSFDLALDADREAAGQGIKALPMRDFTNAYRHLLAIAKRMRGVPEIYNPVDGLIRQLDGAANDRGFLPGRGIPSPTCITGKLGTLDIPVVKDKRFAPYDIKKDADVRPYIFYPSFDGIGRRELMIKTSRFDHPVLDTLLQGLRDILDRLPLFEPKREYVHYGYMFVKRVQAMKLFDRNGKRRTEAEIEQARRNVERHDALPRVTKGIDDTARIVDLETFAGKSPPGAAVPPAAYDPAEEARRQQKRNKERTQIEDDLRLAEIRLVDPESWNHHLTEFRGSELHKRIERGYQRLAGLNDEDLQAQRRREIKEERKRREKGPRGGFQRVRP